MNKKIIGVKHHPLLIALAKGDSKLRNTILRTCDVSCIRFIAQIASNLISGSITLTPGQKRRLSKYKNILRELRHRGTSLAAKRKLLIRQKGGAGFLPLVIPLVASALGGLINRIFK